MNRYMLAAGLLLLAGCGNLQSGDGGEGTAAVQPSRVTEAELRAAATDPRLVRFYESRQWQPVWTADKAAALVEAIGAAARHGLDPQALLAGAARSDAPAAREAGLSLAALNYAEALARGQVDPKRIRDTYAVPRPEADLGAGLVQAVDQSDIASWFDGLAPQDEEYRLLSQAYVAAVRQASGERRSPIPEGEDIRPGASDPRLPVIADALRASGHLAAAGDGEAQPAGQAPSQAAAYGEDMVAAVRRLQEDYGLEADGVVDAATLAAINHSGFDRARTLAVNLERRRWMPREAAPTRIDVNIPAAMLTYWRDGAAADRRRTVVGQPGNETPMMVSPMYRLVANPTWTVPTSIAEEEIEPKGAGYMQRNNMSRNSDGMIVQESGPDNALGMVKFDMRNDQAIYLHDTPAKALFARDQRHSSHGCVRVQDALGFARMIAEQEGVFDDWQEAQASGEQTFVALPREIPVRLLYHTAFVDGGRLRFRPDIYGFDDDVAVALGLASRGRRQAPVHVTDVGP
ncbi:L,D-transpeptidase family protein [Sphingosinicella terrae]|uniref:L,D-transpeptidase family protein n=1 Tax=Sphingosinicella terrae TaxID=2172047 RepID=UPI002548ACDB|nr:L,D-transpeptidase family protein [Sphingosinicella terrae]